MYSNSPALRIKSYSLIYSPSTLNVYYVDTQTSKTKCRPVQFQSFAASTAVLVDELISNNSDIFIASTFSRSQLVKLIDDLRDHLQSQQQCMFSNFLFRNDLNSSIFLLTIFSGNR